MLQAFFARKNFGMETINYVNLENFVSVEDLSEDEVTALIKRAEYFKQGGAVPKLTKPVYVTNMFFEDSSRTHTSFEMAERKMGLTVIPFDPAHSSVNKGETLYDTSLIMNALGVDLEVIRHSQNEYYEDLIHTGDYQHLNIGIVNAGDGSGQHPSQCLLDMMTIHERHAGDPNEKKFDAQAYHEKYGINQKRYDQLKDDTIIMHPGPINHDVELAGKLVEAPKSMFFKQMQNGVFMRMAMIEAVMRGRHLGGLN